MDNEFEHVSAINIASSLRTDGCLYTGNHDTSNIEWLSNSINHNGTRILQQQDGRLRTTYSAIQLPWFQTFIDKLVEDGWLMYNHGYIERVIKTLEDKTFYQIRAWLVSGAVSSKAPIFLTIMSGLVKRDVYMNDELLFSLHNDYKYAATKKLLKADRLYSLLYESERLRVVNHGRLRTCISEVLGWQFKVVNSIGEHHFHWDKDNQSINCKILNGKDVKRYGVGKALKRIGVLMMQDEPTLEQIKTVSQYLKNFGTGTFEVIGGDDIGEYYNESRMYKAGSIGTMKDGCMRYESMRNSINNIYSGNASMLILRSNEDKDKIIGRANLWTTDKGVLFMDRIYSGEDNIILFKKWAKDNGYMHKRRQTYGAPRSVTNTHSDESVEIKMDITICNYKDLFNENGNIEVPYMDTFKYINTDDGRMINYAPDNNEDGTWWLMENTNGHAQRVNTEYRMDY